MKIVYLHQHYRSPQMPGSTRSYEMAKRFAAHGHEVHVITSDQREDEAGNKNGWWTTNDDGFTVHWLRIPYSNKMGYASRIQAFVSFALRSAFRAASLKPDVVFAASTPLTTAIPGVFSSKRNGVPMVFEVQDLWPEIPIALGALRNPVMKWASKELERFAYRNASHVVALSPGMKAGVVRESFPKDRVIVAPNSCDFDLFDVPREEGEAFRSKYDWLKDRPLLVYTGTLGLVNGLSYLVRLAAHVKNINPEVRFLIVGTGREEAEVRTLAARMGVLNENLFMIPELAKYEMPAVLSAASMSSSFVVDVPELWHNSANKFFDTLAASRPIVINHEGWQADLIRKQDIGVVLDARDLDRAAHQFLGAILDTEWLKGAGARANALGREQFDRDVLANRILDTLETAVREASGPRTR